MPWSRRFLIPLASSRHRLSRGDLDFLPRRETTAMEFAHPTIAAVVLVELSLWIQSAGMAALINWGLAYLAHRQRLSLVHSTALIVRVTNLMIGLHLAQILVWAAFYRWICFPAWSSAFYFSIASYSTLGDSYLVVPATWRS